MVFLKVFKLILVFFALSALVSCDSSDGGANSSAATTGRVSLLITDGITNDFDQVNLTVESISFLSEGNGHETIVFNEARIVDLLALQNYSDLLVTAVIPVGTYNKIRLHVSQVELVKLNPDGTVLSSDIAKLPANGKVDLNPRGSFVVAGNSHLMVELDVDAEKSIHIVEKGNKLEYNFRPVVFVNILGEEELKLVILDGRVWGKTGTGFHLCEVEVLAVNASCLAVKFSENTRVQNHLIEWLMSDSVNDGDIVTVLGKLGSEHVGALHIVIASDISEEQNLALFKGKATSVVTPVVEGNEFSMQTIVQPLTVSLIDGSGVLDDSGVRIFDKYGAEVNTDAIVVNKGITAFGLASPDLASVTDVKAAFIIVDNDVKDDKVSGIITVIDETEPQIIVTVANNVTFSGDVCVDVNTAIMFKLAIVDGKVVSKEIPFADLEVGMPIDVYGQNTGLTCSVAANVVLVADPLAVTPPGASLLVTGN